MLLRLSFKSTIVILMGLCLLVTACGKKTSTKDDIPQEPPRTPEINPSEDFLSKQNVSCDNNQACPNYIAKLVVFQGGDYKFCTGFLVDDGIVATSSSCLPNLIRRVGHDCSKDVFLFFPKTYNRPAERASCLKVLQASELDGKDAVLWRDDVSFLKISNNIEDRRMARISRNGVQDRKMVSTWTIDQQGEHSAIIKKSSCEAVHNNYINPLTVNESSPNLIFADCEATNGSTGAPIIDNRTGYVLAVISKGMDQGLRTYLESTGLLAQGLKSMTHATNFACAPFLNNNEMLDERECLKDLNYVKVDRARSDMLSTTLLFAELKKKLENSISKLSKHISFGVSVIPNGDTQETKIYPKCFKPLNGWLASYGNRNTYVDQVVIPNQTFKRSMTPYGIIQGTAVENSSKEFSVQYSLKNLRSMKKATVIMWSGDEDAESYPSVTENCSVSLL